MQKKLSEASKHDSLVLSMLATIPSMVYVFDLDINKYTFINEKIADLFGYDIQELLQSSVEVLRDKLYPQDFPVIKEKWTALLKGTDEQTVILDYRYKDSKGQWLWVKDSIKIFSRHEGGRVAQIVGTISDITAEKDAEKDIQRLTRHYAYHNQRLKEQNEVLEAQEKSLIAVNEELVSQQEVLKMAFDSLLTQKNELNEANKELSDRNFELDQFVYKISHDIRSPLTSVLGLVNLMKMETDYTRLIHSVEHIEKSVLKLDTFVKSMLDFARISRENVKLEEIYFYILIDDCMNNFRYLENFNTLAIHIDVQENGNKFYSEALRVSSIFQNIISNAIKYKTPHIFDSFLDIKIDVTPTVANITFSDNGIGIKEEYLDKVFGMFVRATERSDGSGLGLYIVKQSVERLNGTIEIESTYGTGTKISMQLPNLYATLPTY
jgi:PAS domain S-box-containing protein